MSVRIYIEGGGDSKDLGIRLRKAFASLFGRLGWEGRMPSTVSGGGRDQTFDKFKTAHRNATEGRFVAMLVDSEDSVRDIEKPWDHLKRRDGWDRPEGASDNQALLMVVCMETWIVADRPSLKSHYGSNFREGPLPDLLNLESRDRGSIQDSLYRATRDCSNAYLKGKRSFEILAKLQPEALRELPSFRRFERVIETYL